ncbi:acyl-CoA N-acyltransferase [Thozetella sp. PMI_491]|nr:acyl-CoA N-acyltransferase [Thozetella sp. PMI_491]
MSPLFASQRLVYKALEDTQADLDFVFSAFQDETTIHPGSIGIPRPMTRQKSNEFVRRVVEKALLFVKVCLPPSGATAGQDDGADVEVASSTPVGFLGLSSFGAGKEPTLQTKVGPVFIAPEHRRKGYATEAMNWIMDWAFLHSRMHRMALETSGANEGANALYRGLGFVEEGRLREAHYFGGKWLDIVQFSILESEWKALRATERDGVMVTQKDAPGED